MQRTKNLFGLGGKSSSMDLKAEVKRLMFSADKEKEPVLVTTDHGKFTMVMSAFTTYEKQVCTCTVYSVHVHVHVLKCHALCMRHLYMLCIHDFGYYLNS